jgi:hypothetical protein
VIPSPKIKEEMKFKGQEADELSALFYDFKRDSSHPFKKMNVNSL